MRSIKMSNGGTCLSIGLHSVIPTDSFPVTAAFASLLHMQSNNEGLFPDEHKLRKQALSYGLAV